MIMNLKRIIKEELENLQWIKDIKSNQDIAQEIADNAEIDYKGKRIHMHLHSSNPSDFFLFSHLAYPSLSLISTPSFYKHCKEIYGLNDDEIKDIWNRYKKIINDRINNKEINESDDFKWIKDSEPIPIQIKKVPTLPNGEYKLWLGNISKEEQLAIIDYLINVIEKDDNLVTSSSLYSIKERIIGNKGTEINITSLYFDIIHRSRIDKHISVSMMSTNSNVDQKTKDERLEYTRNYYDNESKSKTIT